MRNINSPNSLNDAEKMAFDWMCFGFIVNEYCICCAQFSENQYYIDYQFRCLILLLRSHYLRQLYSVLFKIFVWFLLSFSRHLRIMIVTTMLKFTHPLLYCTQWRRKLHIQFQDSFLCFQTFPNWNSISSFP